jgi:hypothetical protein
MNSKLPLLLLTLANFASPLSAHADEKLGKLHAYDGVTKPGKPAQLRAKLERVIKGISRLGIKPDVEGEVLGFYLLEAPVTDPRYSVALEAPRYIGKATTADGGLATLSFTPPRTGVYRIEARIGQGSDYIAFPAPMTVAAYDPSSSIIAVDLDETITDRSSLSASVKDNDEIQPRPHALETLRRLTQEQNLRVIYITSRDSGFINKTRAWFVKHELPKGPIFFWDFWERSWSEETFKTRLIAELKSKQPGLRAGLGDSVSDAKAFIANRLVAHILSPAPNEDLPSLALRCRDWRRFGQHFKLQEETRRLLQDVAHGSHSKRTAAAQRLARIGDELGPLSAPYRDASDLSLSVAARQNLAHSAARRSYVKALDRATPRALICSLIAAWKTQDPYIIAALHRQPEAVLDTVTAPFQVMTGVEILARVESDESTVSYQLRVRGRTFAGDDRSDELQLTVTRRRDGLWSLESPDF